VAINEEITNNTSTHLDFNDSGYNYVVPWGEYKRGVGVMAAKNDCGVETG
jgi:hypothetical protein